MCLSLSTRLSPDFINYEMARVLFFRSFLFFFAVLFAAQQSIHLSDSGLVALIDSFVSRLQSGIVSRKFTAAASAASTGGCRLPVAGCRLPCSESFLLLACLSKRNYVCTCVLHLPLAAKRQHTHTQTHVPMCFILYHFTHTRYGAASSARAHVQL